MIAALCVVGVVLTAAWAATCLDESPKQVRHNRRLRAELDRQPFTTNADTDPTPPSGLDILGSLPAPTHRARMRCNRPECAYCGPRR